MTKVGPQELFGLVQSFFVEYLPRQRGASQHTIRAYRDAVRLLLLFVAQHRCRDVAALELGDLAVDAVAAFLDHIEINRSNSAATRNCRRAAPRHTTRWATFLRRLMRRSSSNALSPGLRG